MPFPASSARCPPANAIAREHFRVRGKQLPSAGLLRLSGSVWSSGWITAHGGEIRGSHFAVKAECNLSKRSRLRGGPFRRTARRKAELKDFSMRLMPRDEDALIVSGSRCHLTAGNYLPDGAAHRSIRQVAGSPLDPVWIGGEATHCADSNFSALGDKAAAASAVETPPISATCGTAPSLSPMAETTENCMNQQPSARKTLIEFDNWRRTRGRLQSFHVVQFSDDEYRDSCETCRRKFDTAGASKPSSPTVRWHPRSAQHRPHRGMPRSTAT